MNEELHVIYVNDSDGYKKIVELYKDPEINATFDGYRRDRVAASEISFLICLNDLPIGYILLVREKDRKESLGVDIAIKKDYRAKGYGKKTMEIFKQKFLKQIKDTMHFQVKKENIAAIKILDILDNEYIETKDDTDFYKISSRTK